jgi:hypothetical protein
VTERWEIAQENLETHKDLDVYDEGEDNEGNAYGCDMHCGECGASGMDWDYDSDILSFTCEQYKAAHPSPDSQQGGAT